MFITCCLRGGRGVFWSCIDCFFYITIQLEWLGSTHKPCKIPDEQAGLFLVKEREVTPSPGNVLNELSFSQEHAWDIGLGQTVVYTEAIFVPIHISSFEKLSLFGFVRLYIHPCIYSLILKYRKMLQTISIVYISYKPISLASRSPCEQIITSELLYLTSYKMFDLVSIHALLVIGLIVLCKPCSAQGPLVTLPHGGQLRGISTTSQQTQIDIFLGKFETVM